jgi:hypothetical protein
MTIPVESVYWSFLRFSEGFFNVFTLMRMQDPVLATSEVIPSRALTALEGEGRGLSHLQVVARGAVVAPASQ